MGGFQTAVNLYNPLAVAGDFASSNPRATVLAEEGALVAGPGGVTVGKFAWVSNGVVTNYATHANGPDGFVHRDQQGLITQYLQDASMLIPQGFPVVLHNAGDFFAVNKGPVASAIGQNVYASEADGSIYTGSAPSGASATGSIGATFTATGTGTSLVVTSVTGLISIGDTISGTGVPAGTKIVAQVSGTTGGAGTYTTSAATTASAATVTSFGNVLNVTAVGSGSIAVGDSISGTGIPAGAQIASVISGGGSAPGVYTIDIAATAYAASTTVTVTGGVETNFVVGSVCAVGELVKISTWTPAGV